MDSKLSETVDKLKSEKRNIARKVFELKKKMHLKNCGHPFNSKTSSRTFFIF